MKLGFRGARPRVAGSVAVAICAWTLLGATAPALATSASARTPNLVTGSAYLVAARNLIAGHYYESFPGAADFGLTIDGALALAATGDDDGALRKIVAFIDSDGKDPSGRTVNDWTGIGTSDVSGGSIGKEALLAEVVGDNPRNFGGHNLIAALDASVCSRPSTGASTSCPGTGSYRNDTSVFDQALGIMAQLRAGQVTEAAWPVVYLESLQSADGSFPSLIPPSGGPDVDSTAMAVMALALADGSRAAADVRAGLRWIASQQKHNGGFPSAGAESVNSTGLAIQALTLRAAAYRARIGAALGFLAREQNGNGGFDADAGQHSSNLRASTQAVGGAVGTSFGTLRRPLRHPAPKASSSAVSGLGAAAGQHSATPAVPAKAAGASPARGAGASPARGAGASPARGAGASPGARSQQQSHPSPGAAYRGILASDTTRGLPAYVIWPPVGLAAVAIGLSVLLTWRQRRSRQRAEPDPAGSPGPAAEALHSEVQQSPASGGVRS